MEKREIVQPQPGSSGDPKVSSGLPPTNQTPEPAAPDAAKIRQFFGSVEIDMVRPIKALETIIEAVVIQLQHSPGAKVKLTLDIEATSPDGFSESDTSVVRDNARQLKFKPESTGFEE